MNDKIDDVSDKIDDIFLDASEDLQFVRMDENQFDDYNTRTSKINGAYIIYPNHPKESHHLMIIKYNPQNCSLSKLRIKVSDFKKRLQRFGFKATGHQMTGFASGMYTIHIKSMKQNESVFRSPKWLQDYLDFEIRTGQDIKGGKSKRQIQREQEEAEANSRRKWNVAWDRMMDDLNMKHQFKVFMVSEYPKYAGRDYLSTAEMESFKTRYRGDHTVWSNFEKFLKKKEESDKYTLFVNEIIEEMESDWRNNGDNYSDRMSDNTSGSGRSFTYTFAKRNRKNSTCSRTVTMIFKKDSKGSYTGESEMDIQFEIFDQYLGKNTRYNLTTSGLLINRFIKFINSVTESSKRSGGGKYYGGSSSNSNYSNSKKSEPKGKYDTPKTGNKDRDRYNLLKDKYKLRKEQLDGMSENDPTYTSLKNELDNYKRAIDRMKDQHKFETLISWEQFIK